MGLFFNILYFLVAQQF